MKLFLVLILVGCASATLFEALEQESRAAVSAFINGMQTGEPLHVALGIEDSDEVQRFERSLKDELEKHIKDAFEKALKRIEEANKNGTEVNKEALEKLRDLRDKMVELDVDEEELKEGLDNLKSKVDTHLRLILEKMGIIDKRSAEPESFESMLGDLSLRDIFLKLKNMILEKMDIAAVKNSLANIVGKGTQKLCEWLTNRGKEKVLNFFDRILESDEETEKRAAEDRFEKVRDYLENIEQDVHNKLAKFKQWLHDLINRGLDEAKDELQNVREIVREIISHGKNLTKKGLAEILDYLRQQEDKLGSLSEIKNVLHEILQKKD